MQRLFLLFLLTCSLLKACQTDSFEDVVQHQTLERNAYRSYNEALTLAEEAISRYRCLPPFVSNKRNIMPNKGQCIKRPITRNGVTSEEPIMYIFNNENNEGFTIIAANRDVSPIIAVTENGNYTYGEPSGVEPFDMLMENTIRQYSYNQPSIDLPPLLYSYTDTVININKRVDPLITTNWGQAGIYGKLCTNGLSGCSNTAAAQIMAYNRYPTSMTITYDNSNDIININWSSILKHTACSQGHLDSSKEYICNCGCDYNTISIIMRQLGHLADSLYMEDNPETTENELCTSTSDYKLKNALQLLGYDNAINVFGIDLSAYDNVIYNNLHNNDPIIISGCRDLSKGHAWVLDGYIHEELRVDYYIRNPNIATPGVILPEYIIDHSLETITKLLHFNWGWNGKCNGWFNFGCFHTGDAVEYDHSSLNNNSSYDYQFYTGLIYNIFN